jgi:P27 family predicted phage terminase small subunit
LPPLKKPTERRQRRNGPKTASAKKKTTAKALAKKAGLEVVAGGVDATAAQPKVPKADALWLASTKKQWGEFWSSAAAKKLAPALDLAAVERLFTLYDERARSLATFRRNRLVKGSQGQVVLNPLGRQINSLNTAILQLEDRLGLSPLARLKMNIALDDPDGDEPGFARRAERVAQPRR